MELDNQISCLEEIQKIRSDRLICHFLSMIFSQPQNKNGLNGLRTESPKKNEEQTLQNNVCEIKLKKN